MTLRDDLKKIRDEALEAVNPYRAVKNVLRREAARVHIGAEMTWDMEDCAGLWLIAAGKAAVPMAQAAVDELGAALARGVVVTKHEHAAGHTLPARLEVIEAGHPVPDEAGLASARAMMSLARKATAEHRVLVLLSGGGSALLPLPAADLTLEDLQTTTGQLLRAGATIDEINAIRKHLSQLKGGQLARQAAPAPVVALILSDVVGDPLDVIASGPTAPDPTTFADAQAVLARYDLHERVPARVQETLAAGAAGELRETPKPGDPLFARVRNVIIGSNRRAAQAAVETAERLGYRALLLSTFIEGEAREVARVAAALVKGIRAHGDPLPPPACLIWGGETTVTVRGAGRGGRNQELALAAALALAGRPDWAIMALATDGADGPTDAAGAIVDGETIPRARERGWDPHATLAANNAYPLLDAVDALINIGPTGTNVNDLLVILVKNSSGGSK
ncbi:MAG: glycerate kinase [Anaerolineales bacterium]